MVDDQGQCRSRVHTPNFQGSSTACRSCSTPVIPAIMSLPFQPRCHLKEHGPLGYSFRGPWFRVNHAVFFASTCERRQLRTQFPRAPEEGTHENMIQASYLCCCFWLFLFHVCACVCVSVATMYYCSCRRASQPYQPGVRHCRPKSRRQRMTASSSTTSLLTSYFLTCIAFPDGQLC
jgi:hypothetical protein